MHAQNQVSSRVMMQWCCLYLGGTGFNAGQAFHWVLQ